ncbi:MAG: hypothetical protein IKE95_08190 [Methanobrevibacter sp.]|nr:hypothetical protein [Methanobrevibacter sp.]
MRCPNCGEQLDEDNYCTECMEFFDEDDFDDSFGYDDGFDEPDYDSMVNNGDEICLNCTYWSVSPYGAAHGMVCRKGYFTDGPDDSCGDFVQSHHFANYGDSGQYQFDETGREISNKLRYWQNSR